MLIRYDVVPHRGVGPVQLGMAREAVRACMAGAPRVFHKGRDGPEVDGWHENGFQVFYGKDDTVEFVELSRDAVDARLFGLAVFETDVAELVRSLEERCAFDASDADYPYCYLFPELDLSLRRRFLPEHPADPEGRVFDTVGVGIRGYYGRGS